MTIDLAIVNSMQSLMDIVSFNLWKKTQPFTVYYNMFYRNLGQTRNKGFTCIDPISRYNLIVE